MASAPDPAQLQQSILIEVGAGLDGKDDDQKGILDLLTQFIGVYWNMYSSRSYFPYLQYLYTKRHCLYALLGQLRTKITKSLGSLNKQLNQLFQNAAALLKQTEDELKRVEKEAAANRPGTVAATNVTGAFEPVIKQPLWRLVDPWQVDPNLPLVDPMSPEWPGKTRT